MGGMRAHGSPWSVTRRTSGRTLQLLHPAGHPSPRRRAGRLCNCRRCAQLLRELALGGRGAAGQRRHGGDNWQRNGGPLWQLQRRRWRLGLGARGSVGCCRRWLGGCRRPAGCQPQRGLRPAAAVVARPQLCWRQGHGGAGGGATFHARLEAAAPADGPAQAAGHLCSSSSSRGTAGSSRQMALRKCCHSPCNVNSHLHGRISLLLPPGSPALHTPECILRCCALR